MKIAVPVKHNNEVDEHFGHCESYNVYTIDENKKISQLENIPSPQGCGCKSNIAAVLAEKEVTLMLAGGIGGGAINVLAYHGIDVIRGCSGDATKTVELLLQGNLSDSGISCQHHENHDHQCNHG